MSYRSLGKKSPETPPSAGKFSSRVYETNINIYWMKFSVTFKLFAFQEDSKRSFCPWQVLGFLGLTLKNLNQITLQAKCPRHSITKRSGQQRTYWVFGNVFTIFSMWFISSQQLWGTGIVILIIQRRKWNLGLQNSRLQTL